MSSVPVSPAVSDVTAVPALSAAEEEARLRELTEPRPRRVIAVSDLHLGAGRDPVTGTFPLTENFFADDTFAAFLAAAAAPGGTLLVLNGDIVDFLRLCRCPRTPEDFDRWGGWLARLDEADRARTLERTLTRVERVYGLRTDDFKCVWKLMLAVTGHPTFFQALADWVAAGGTLVILAGNHDPEWHWPLVRRALRDELSRRGAPVAAVVERVAFGDAGIDLANLHVEHGHRFEEMTRVDGPVVLSGDATQLNLPLGSFVNRYFANRIERLDPFIDNGKRVEQAVLSVLRRRPLTMIRIYVRAWRFMGRVIAMRRFNGSVALIALGLALPFLPLVLLAIPGAWPALMRLLAPLGGTGSKVAGGLSGAVLTALLPYLAGAATEVARRIPFLHGADPYLAGARVIGRERARAGAWSGVYVCLGHTHASLVAELAPDAAGLYVNTGTWIGQWPDDRPDLVARYVYSYARFDLAPEGGYQHQALEWDASAGTARAARILVPADA